MPTDNQTVYVTVYTNKWPDDGFEIGSVHATESLAEEATEDHADAEKMRELGWENVRRPRVRGAGKGEPRR